MITVVSSPSQYNFCNADIKYVLNMTGIDSPTERKYFAYKLVSTSGDVTPELYYYPQEGVDFEILFDKEIFSILNTPTPAVPTTRGYIGTVDSMIGEFKLVYWEITYAKNEAGLFCELTVGEPVETSEFYVINGALDYHRPNNINPAMEVLSLRPELTVIGQRFPDFIYVFATASVDFNIVCFDSEGLLLGAVTGTTPVSTPSVLLYNAGWSTGADLPAGTAYIYVSLSSGDAIYSYNLAIEDLCDHDVLAFVCQYGGVVTVAGLKNDTSASVRQGIAESRYIQSVRGRGGAFTADKSTSHEYTYAVESVVVDEVRDEWFYDQFVASGRYMKLFTDIDDVKFFIPLIGNDIDRDVRNQVMTGKFRIHVEHSQPNAVY